MSFLKLGCIIAASLTLGAVIGYAVSAASELPRWAGVVVGGLLGLLAARLAARLLDQFLGRFDESIHPYG